MSSEVETSLDISEAVRDSSRLRIKLRQAGAFARNDKLRRRSATVYYATRPQQFLYFFPLPQGHGSLRPTFGIERRIGKSIDTSPAPSPSPATPAIAPTGCG